MIVELELLIIIMLLFMVLYIINKCYDSLNHKWRK